MSGMYKGLQARIRAGNEKILCALQSTLSQSGPSGSVKVQQTFCDTSQSCGEIVAYAISTGSLKCHAALVKLQESLYPEQPVMELQQLSDTKWPCREKALEARQRNLKAILNLLDDISHSDIGDIGDVQIYRNATNFMFILCTKNITPVLEVTAVVSDSLQKKKGLDHTSAYKVVDYVLYTALQTMKSEDKFREIFGCAPEKAESLNIPVLIAVPIQERKRKVPVYLQHSPIVSQVGAQFESKGIFHE